MIKKTPNPVDRHVGSRVRMRRLMLDVSQIKLASALGVTFQQVQKYENGANRISASRLKQISTYLQAPISFFFEGAPGFSGKSKNVIVVPSTAYVSDFLATSVGHSLIKAFISIKNAKLRHCIVHLVEEVAREHH